VFVVGVSSVAVLHGVGDLLLADRGSLSDARLAADRVDRRASLADPERTNTIRAWMIEMRFI
jgi:hypothetical protein